MMKISVSRFAAAAAVALLVGVGTAALGQPAMGPGHHGPGPGMGMDIEHVLAGLQAKLNLNTSQQGMWDAAVAQTMAARDTGHANMQKLHDALAAELANTTPNLAGVAAVADDVQTSNQTLRRSVRDQWLKLYATFSSDQIAVVKAALQQRLARMDSFHQKMLERMQQKQGG